jgi:hypothetical protein
MFCAKAYKVKIRIKDNQIVTPSTAQWLVEVLCRMDAWGYVDAVFKAKQ